MELLLGGEELTKFGSCIRMRPPVATGAFAVAWFPVGWFAVAWFPVAWGTIEGCTGGAAT
jgi:hypothetical protein